MISKAPRSMLCDLTWASLTPAAASQIHTELAHELLRGLPELRHVTLTLAEEAQDAVSYSRKVGVHCAEAVMTPSRDDTNRIQAESMRHLTLAGAAVALPRRTWRCGGGCTAWSCGCRAGTWRRTSSCCSWAWRRAAFARCTSGTATKGARASAAITWKLAVA